MGTSILHGELAKPYRRGAIRRARDAKMAISELGLIRWNYLYLITLHNRLPSIIIRRVTTKIIAFGAWELGRVSMSWHGALLRGQISQHKSSESSSRFSFMFVEV